MLHTFKVVVKDIFLSLQALCIVVFVEVNVVLVFKVLWRDKFIVIERTFIDVELLINWVLARSDRCHEILWVRLLFQL